MGIFVNFKSAHPVDEMNDQNLHPMVILCTSPPKLKVNRGMKAQHQR